jgi:hypothetical protein
MNIVVISYYPVRTICFAHLVHILDFKYSSRNIENVQRQVFCVIPLFCCDSKNIYNVLTFRSSADSTLLL